MFVDCPRISHPSGGTFSAIDQSIAGSKGFQVAVSQSANASKEHNVREPPEEGFCITVTYGKPSLDVVQPLEPMNIDPLKVAPSHSSVKSALFNVFIQVRQTRVHRQQPCSGDFLSATMLALLFIEVRNRRVAVLCIDQVTAYNPRWPCVLSGRLHE